MNCPSGCRASSRAATVAATARSMPPRSARWRNHRSSADVIPELQGGGYGFGDAGALSTRTHIENTIEDSRLAPQANEEAKRIAAAFADELEGHGAREPETRAVAPMLTEAQLAEFERNLDECP